MKILLVEDDMVSLTVMKHILASKDHTVLSANNADEALQIVSRQVVDLVISDQEMPGKKGLQLLEEINQMMPQIPLILVTGHSETDELDITINLFSKLTKPIGSKQLLACIDELKRSKSTNNPATNNPATDNTTTKVAI